MHLLSVGVAKSIWLFDMNELNPQGKAVFPEALAWLGEKYSFQSFPKQMTDIDNETKGLLFKTGEFPIDTGSINVNLSIFTDGLVAETWTSTERCDLFLEDVLRSAASKYGLLFEPHMIRKKLYMSEITVRLDSDFGKFGHKFSQFCESLNKLFARHRLPPFEMSGMIFAPDTSGTSYKPPGFFIERKTNLPFEENRFWSKSPFTTRDHLAALEDFDKLMAG